MAIDNTHASIANTTNLKQMTPRVREATAAELSTYIGTRGEIWYDTTNDILKVMDGVTAGGTSIGAGVGFTPDTDLTFQAFTIKFVNTAGTIQHSVIHTPDGAAATVASPYASLFTGASTTLANTPNGTLSSTDFTSGVVLTGGNLHQINLNFPDQDATKVIYWAKMGRNTAGLVASSILCDLLNADINGTTRTRPRIQLSQNVGGTVTPYALNTTNLTSGEQLHVDIWGFFSS